MEQEIKEETKSGIKGRSFIVLGVLLLMGIFAFAGVAIYMSNTAIATMQVDSPVDIALAKATIVGNDITTHTAWTDTLVINQVFGGETVELGLKAENLSNANITGRTLEVIITNDNNDVVSGDITSVTIFDISVNNWITPTVDINDLDGVNTYSITMAQWNAKTVYIYPVKITYGIVNSAVYTVTINLLN